jgi:hypothetical protein
MRRRERRGPAEGPIADARISITGDYIADRKRRFEFLIVGVYLRVVRRSTSAPATDRTKRPDPGQEHAMKLADTHPGTALYGLFAQAFSTQPRTYASLPAFAVEAAGGTTATGLEAKAGRPTWFARLGEWLYRRQLRNVGVYLKESDDIFAQLDHWRSKQRAREAEAWLAQSRDVHELEARIRELEHGRGRIAF